MKKLSLLFCALLATHTAFAAEKKITLFNTSTMGDLSVTYQTCRTISSYHSGSTPLVKCSTPANAFMAKAGSTGNALSYAPLHFTIDPISTPDNQNVIDSLHILHAKLTDAQGNIIAETQTGDTGVVVSDIMATNGEVFLAHDALQFSNHGTPVVICSPGFISMPANDDPDTM